LDDARRRGDIPRSPDAQTAAAYLGLAVAMAFAARDSAAAIGATLAGLLADPAARGPALLRDGGQSAAELVLDVAVAALPLVLFPAGAVLAFLVASRGIVLAPQRLMPQLSRLSPVDNAAQKYGPPGLVEFAKATAKIALLLAVLAIALWRLVDTLPLSVHVPARGLMRLLEAPTSVIMQGVIVVALAVGTVDFLYQRHAHAARLRMSRHEMKKEMRETEGDPDLMQRRRERGKALANNRMLAAVPGASVVITNPTHVAVALAWAPGDRGAPRCVAKGTDAIALRIRAAAETAGVPVREDPPTARALHAATAIGAPDRRPPLRRRGRRHPVRRPGPRPGCPPLALSRGPRCATPVGAPRCATPVARPPTAPFAARFPRSFAGRRTGRPRCPPGGAATGRRRWGGAGQGCDVG
ncbi:MAG: EscU/YscU/HrcU family type III secretion system export apparatus switch protein, partial [Pseudomonadota bacterium]